MSVAPELQPAVIAKLDAMVSERDALARQLSEPDVLADHRKVRDLSQRKSELEGVVEPFLRVQALRTEIAECEKLAAGSDRDMAEMARAELPGLSVRVRELTELVLAKLVSSDDARVRSVILELRAGTGGDEAALWCRDLLEMYGKYAASKGWTFEALDVTADASVGGVRSAVVEVKGEGVWTELSFEAGVHSVKRVPATETQGRIHTSTATVAVLPEAEDVDVKIDWAGEVEEFATRAQGPGGQNVNKVETAWQIHHKPTGIIIKMMEAKSQQQNRERARRLLMTRLHEAERQRQHAERSAARKSQIRGGERSDKIRTYRFKDGIVADERLAGEYALRDVMNGDLSKLMKDLVAMETARRLAEL